MSIFTFSVYSQNLPNTLPDTGFVGVGTSSPTCNFQVIGQSQICGNLKVDSSLVISDSARVDNNLRINGHLFVGKNAYITDTTFSNVLRVHRITPSAGDSLLYFGDSSLIMHPTMNYIAPTGGGNIKGMGVGSFSSIGEGLESVAIGYRTRTHIDATRAISIGSGHGSGSNYMYNTIPNSIMLGTNSNLPTIFISPANGPNTTGKVGIGTTTPGTNYESPASLKLDVNGDARFYRNDNSNDYLRVGYNTANAIIDNFGQGSLMINYYSGKDVYIGTGNTKADVHMGKNLFVCGNIKTNKLIVQTGWCDYVFNSDYELLSLTELKKFINDNKHLPDIPSEATIAENGVEVGYIVSRLLLKIEELTLYVIKQDEEITLLQTFLKKISDANQK